MLSFFTTPEQYLLDELQRSLYLEQFRGFHYLQYRLRVVPSRGRRNVRESERGVQRAELQPPPPAQQLVYLPLFRCVHAVE